MKPIEFEEHNLTIAKDQKEYEPLPVFREEEDERGRQVSCWKLSWPERFRLMITGRLWAEVLTFEQPLQPLYFTVKKSEVLSVGIPNEETKFRWPWLSFEDWNRSSGPVYIKERVYYWGNWTPFVWVKFRWAVKPWLRLKNLIGG